MATPIDQPLTTPKIANPAPLGLAGFGLTTVVLSSINAGWLPPEAVPVVVPLAFAYGGIAQLIAGVLEFKTGNIQSRKVKTPHIRSVTATAEAGGALSQPAPMVHLRKANHHQKRP